MKQLIDLFPVVLFFGAYFATKDFTFATQVILLGSLVQLLLHWLIWKKVEKSLLISLAILFPLCGMTLYFQNENFLKWKPTLINWLFALILLGSEWFSEKSITARLIEKTLLSSNPDGVVRLTSSQLKVINYWATGFFFLIGALNLWVAFQFSTDIWVQFKLFGLIGLNFVAMFALMLYIAKQQKETAHEPSSHQENDSTP